MPTMAWRASPGTDRVRQVPRDHGLSLVHRSEVHGRLSVGSIRRLDSLQIEIEDWCIGCERCANQCPFGNINMVDMAGEAKAAKAAEATPEGAEAPAPEFKATVCDLCAGYESPNCVYACPHDAAIRVNPQEFLAPTDRR